MEQNTIKYRTSAKKIVITLTIVFLLLVATTLGDRLVDTLKGDLFALVAIVILIILGVQYSYVQIDRNNIRYVNLLVERRTVPIKNIIKIGYPKQSWYALYSYMYVLYDDPGQPGKDKVMKIIKGAFDENTLSKIAMDLKSTNPNIQVEI
jgi:hypothetical protein